MPLVTVANVGYAYGTSIVLDGATLSVEPGEKVGLVGRNGSGKTTLMKMIRGDIKPESGSIQLQRNARVGYLSQDPNFNPDDTVRDAAESAFAELHDLHLQLKTLYEELATADDDKLDKLLRRQANLEAAVESAGGYAIDHKIDATLHGLGFGDEQFSQPVSVLSGGQKGRLGLAKLLLEQPDLLLLDEPTNHLDIPGRQWLETFLAEEYPGAVMVISHDRWLLDRVVSRIFEIERGQVRDYPGNYHKYVELRRERQLTQARVHEKQQDRIRQEEQFIAKYKTGQRAKQARGRQTRLERYKSNELVDRPAELDTMKLNLPRPSRTGDIVISAVGLSKRYDDNVLFENVDLAISRGDRIGIIGPNGSGKTTLVKCLLGEQMPDTGRVRLGSRVSVGYSKQSHEHLDFDQTIWQYLQSVIISLDGAAKASEQQARDLAGAFLFSGDEQDKTLGLVSGGERSRAVLAGLVAGAHNLLVLDEPTNHLDIPSAERLEQAISSKGGFEGTLLLISHDRALLETTCDQLLIFGEDGGVRQFQGRYSDWVQRNRKEAQQKQAERARPGKQSQSKQQEQSHPPEKQRSSTDPLAKLKTRDLEARIEWIQQRIEQIDEQMLDPAVYSDGEQCRRLQQQRAELAEQIEPLEFEWSRRAELA